MPLIKFVLVSSRPIRGPGKPRIVEPYKPFFAHLSFLKSGAPYALWLQNRLLPVEDYIQRIQGYDEGALVREAINVGVPEHGDIVAAIINKLGGFDPEPVDEPEAVVGLDSLGWRELQAKAKEMGINARQTREQLILAIAEAEALNADQDGE